MDDFDLLGSSNVGASADDSASVPPGAYKTAPAGDLLGDMGGALVPAVNPNAAYPGAPPAPAANNVAQPAFYPTSQPAMQQPQYPAAQPPVAPAPAAYGAPTGAPASQAYPTQPQQQSQYQQQQQYPPQAPAPAFAQPPQSEYGGYPYQQQPQMQQPATGGYPGASYPVPAQQF